MISFIVSKYHLICSGVRRARALVHSRSVAQICQLSHAQITASSLADLSDSSIRTRLKLGENQVPNRARPTANKRSSLVMNNRRRSAQYVSPIITTPTAPERKSLIINTVTTEEPESLDIPTTPTSVTTSFSDTTTVVDCNSSVSSSKDYYERMKASEEEEKPSATELLFQAQLLKKREMEEARFRQTLKKEEQTKEKPQAIQVEHKPTDDTNNSLDKRSSHPFSTSSTLLNTPTKNVPPPATTQPLSATTTTTNTATKNVPVINNENSVDEPKKVIMTGFVSVQTRKSPVKCIVIA